MFKKLQFHYKLFIGFSLIIFAILIVSSGLFYFYTGSIVETNIVETQQQTAQKIQEQLELVLSQIDNLTISVNASDFIMNLLENMPDEGEANYFDKFPRVSEELRNYLFSLTALKPLKGRISIISKYADYMDFSNRPDTQNITKNDVRQLDFVKEGMKTEQFKLFLPPHPDEWSNKGTVFSVVRPLRNNNYEIQGLIEVSYNVEALERLFQFKNQSQVLKGVVIDANQQVIYDNFQLGNDKSWLLNTRLASDAYGNYEVKNPQDGKAYVVTFNKPANYDWTILLLEDLTVIQKPIFILRSLTIISYLSIFTIFIIILYIYTKNITRPIRSLKKSVISVNMDSLRLKLNLAQGNELTLLAQAFQDLLDEVKGNMNLMVESQAREMSAHMLALQAQMNPHFLYNTLAVIGAYGIKKGNDEVMQMCADLSDMLRYTIDLDNGQTKIRTEIAHVEKYLKLMSLRFEHYLEYNIDIDESLWDMPIPKLTLEPIIENVFRHGFNDVEPPWVLTVKGYIKERRWYIEMKDNGNGFEAASIEQLKVSLKEGNDFLNPQHFTQSKANGGMGLMNTFMRLHYFYKGEETIEFFNAAEGGAIIRIGGPLVE
ncbi:sensor histidine kinase [Paenibacillus psychroresistens]|uniref:Sensor histidine kinase n=1 Tax=Paenibacillus psychroresistens TaxID=1778678 RepID=A0A6B8RE22_9BACL|nr:sensor histidine kinase [Paenibacillus psychroresistens]QGQ94469.1 sensor histidine kinase [Paenibacillus psychroresistens]